MDKVLQQNKVANYTSKLSLKHKIMNTEKNSSEAQSQPSCLGFVSGINYQIYFSAYRKNKLGKWKHYIYPPIITDLQKEKAIEVCRKLNTDLQKAGYVGNGYYCYKSV